MRQLVDGALDGVEATLNESLNGVLGLLALLLDTVQQQIVSAIMDQIGPNLLDPLGDALVPILTGTVNKQVTGTDGSVEVTALSLAVAGETATLDLARSSCGPNSVRQVADDTNADEIADADVDADADADVDAVADADADADEDADGSTTGAIADADSAADADASATLPDAGAPNLLPFFLLGLALLGFGLAVLLNERRRLGLPGSNNLA